MKHQPKTSAFTLIEILIVISIIGIVASLGFLTFSESTKELALDNSYATVLTALESARNNAMRGAGDGASGQTITISNDGKSIITDTVTLPLYSGVTINQTGNSFVFERISGKISNETTFILTNSNGQTKTITINQNGYVSDN